MPFRILGHETVEAGVRRIAAEQVERAIDAVTGGEESIHEGVHDARKRCKKVRAVIRLVRPALGDTYRRENARFRDAGRLVSDARDATAIIETFDGHLAAPFAGQLDGDRLSAVRGVLVERRDEVVDGLGLDDRVAELVDALRAGRVATQGWSLTDDGWDALGPGLGKTYGRARKAMAAAYDERTTEAFHEWRKRAKYHRYHLKLLRELWPGPVKARRTACHDLTDYLGDDHDLAVLRGVLEQEAGRFDDGDLRVMLAVLDRRRGELQALARPVGSRLLAETPDRFVERFGAYWSAWRAERDVEPAFQPPLAAHSAA